MTYGNILKFKEKHMKITFHMKSGRDLVVEADDITINKSGNDLRGWEMTKVKNQGECFYINIDQVEAITYK